MAQTTDQTLEQRLLDLEAAVRAVRTANPFGLVASTDLAGVTLTGASGAPGGVAWPSYGPHVDLYVASGRLRVEVAAAISVSGNKASAFMSWAVQGPAATQADLDAAPVAVTADYTRSVELQHGHSGQDQRGSSSAFGTHTDLDPGWYRVTAQYALSYSGTAYAPSGIFTNRRISAMPY